VDLFITYRNQIISYLDQYYFEGRWMICSYHLTFPIPNNICKRVCGVIQTFENQLKVDEENRRAELAAEQLLAEIESETSTPSKKLATQQKSSKKKK